MDATRLSDGAFVTLKQIKTSKHPDEVKICAMFAAEPLASDPRNHCVPLYEVLQLPNDDDMVLMIMPFLANWRDPEFSTIEELVDLCGQVIEVRLPLNIQFVFNCTPFIHSHNVTHRCDHCLILDGLDLTL